MTITERMEHGFRAAEVLGAGVLAVRQDGIVGYANPAARRILRSTEPLEGRALTEVLASLEQIRSAKEENGRRRVEATLPTGERLLLGYALVQPENENGLYVLLFQELTEFEQLRRERDRLLQLAALGDALPAVLHEVKNPLAAVTALLEVLVEEAHTDCDADLRVALSELRRVSLTLQGLGGLVRGQRMQTTNLSAIDETVRDACRVLDVLAMRRNVRVRAIGANLPPLGLHAGSIAGIVFNLAKNGIDACASRGAGSVSVDACMEGTHFVLRVADDGEGMTPEVVARCTELFFTTKERGTGVGLALCRQVVEQTGGTLDIDSKLGVGSTVTVRIPLSNPT